MRVLAFDIETVPDLNGLNYRDYQYLRSRGARERSEEEVTKEFSLNPFTLFIVSVAGTYIHDGDIGESFVFYMSDLSSEEREEEVFYAEGRSTRVRYLPFRADFVEGKLYELEEELIARFWEEASTADRLVSFNGYSFDGYVLKLRSMIHGIDIPERFLRDREFHFDLLRFLSNGEREKRYKLDFICRKFGIYTPKDILDGSKVPEEFYKGNYDTIALYNLKDSIALAQLYQKLRKYIGEEVPEGELPTEKQLNYLIDLISGATGVSREVVEEIIEELGIGESATKRNVSLIIDIFKRIRELPL
ncbi:putative 3'-5' exonuclease similar to PolB exonuclease domain [Hydrogenivirga caldilitoris]|uniref:Putative 3'-5' exonuclease similar to PolB exonuclease domain n=1 Tax=Hydrogenivirga caldilitoris TaxID=246264 RepID=A0A497XSG0_9AQUI|nr:ribonuclease H-like domain-containing protein [Hydrogenivirga caldilitoris]RLJ70072.1 putative 3'-5' exonuclease similar to PolB exonuclease domain [Hydrogenivirga caldilitoris]